MQDKDEYIAQLEGEISVLKAQLEDRDFPAEEEFRKRRDTLETFDKMPNGTIYRTVRDMRTGVLTFEYVSGSWEKLMGVTAEASLADAKNAFKNVHPDDLPLLMQRIEECLKPLRSFEMEVRYIRPPTNQEFWFQISSYPAREGNFIYADGFVFDITKRKHIEIALAESERKHRFILENTKEVFFIQDVEKHLLTFVGGSTLEMFGYTIEEAKQFSENNELSDIFAPEYRQKAKDIAKEITKDYYETAGSISRFQYEAEFLRKDGSVFQGEISMQLIADKNGKIELAVGIVTNIDSRKQNEFELAEYRSQLELLVQELIYAKEKAVESDKLKSAFLANMSHEIRTPLNAIVGVLQLLDSNTLTPKDRKDCMMLMMNSSNQLAAILDVIIDISKINAGQMTIKPAPVRLNQLMYEILAFFEDYLISTGKLHIELILDDSGFIDGCLTYFDSEHFHQVFYNLISNAFKFTEKGYVCFGYRQSAPDMLEFMVKDTGIGLSPDKQEVIFEPFRQAELGNDRQYGGAGLGLTMSRSLVEMEGGKIWVESTEGEGASFYFTLPYLPIAPEDLTIFDDFNAKLKTGMKSLKSGIIESLNAGIMESLNFGMHEFKSRSVLVVEPTLLKFYYYEKMIAATGANVTRIENLQQWRDLADHSKIFNLVIADASLLDHEEFGIISNLPTVLIVSEEKDKYKQFVGKKMSKIVVPVTYSKILEIMEKYAG